MLKKITNKIKSIFSNNKLFPENEELLKLFMNNSKCYILGSSPTINQLNLHNLEENSTKISMGNFYEHPDIEIINPDVHIFAASHPPITEKVLFNWWTRCDKVLPKSTPVLVEKRDKIIAEKVFIDRIVYSYSYGGVFPIDFTKKIISPWSVTIIGLQLALYCKFKNVFLLGVNHDWRFKEKYSHFYSHNKPSLEYYLNENGVKIAYDDVKMNLPKEKLYRAYELFQQYEAIKREALKTNMKIFNADKYSFFDVFEKIYINKL